MGTSKVYYPGRKELMKCGQYAEILEYINCDKIHVKFDNGYECDTRPEQFRKGEVKNALLKFRCDVGDTNTAKNGHTMTVLQRKDKSHVLICFDDGYEKWVSSQSFISGHVSHPKFPTQKGKSKYIGHKIERDGHTAECVGMKDGKLLIRFDTGENRLMKINQFKTAGFLFPYEDRGEIVSASRKKMFESKFIGQKNINASGLEMEIIDYKGKSQVLVRFPATGYETWSKRQTFLDGAIEDRVATINKYLSMKIMQNCGLYAYITSYTPEEKNPKNRIPAKYTISFEDGVTFENERMHEFLHGRLKHPKRPMTSGSMINNIKIIKKRFNLGTEPQMFCECQKCGWKDIASFTEIYKHKCKE